MKNQYVLPFTALLGTLFALAPLAALPDDGNPLKDASFEQRLSPDDGGWELFEISLFSKNYARSGSHSMFNGGFSRTVAHPPYFIGNVSGAYQEFRARPGSRWRLTGYGLTPAALEGNPAFGILQVSFFDEDGEEPHQGQDVKPDRRRLGRRRMAFARHRHCDRASGDCDGAGIHALRGLRRQKPNPGRLLRRPEPV